MSEKRIALIIGNDSYEHITPLEEPRRDAGVVSDALADAGFDVLSCENTNRMGMLEAWRDFHSKLEMAGPHACGAFYFAGHGVQLDGGNYLLPVDVSEGFAPLLRNVTIPVDDLLGSLGMLSHQIHLLFLDCCRNNPFEHSMRARGGVHRGLTVPASPPETLIGFATEPNRIAGDNGLYASKLAEGIRKQGVSVENMCKWVRVQVSEATHLEQVPWDHSSLRSEFYFHPQVSAELSISTPVGVTSEPVPIAQGRGPEAPSTNHVDALIRQKGHLIHKLKAKDSTGRWAYYFVLVEPHMEAAFMNAIKGDGTLELENLGRVIASNYGDAPSEEVKQMLFQRYGFRV